MNIVYSLTWRYGNFIRSLYKLALPWIVKRTIIQNRRLHVAAYSLSDEGLMPEQVASIRSFFRYVGIPDKFTVVSDGTHTLSSRKLLRRIHSCIDVVDWRDLIKNDLPECIRVYADCHFMGKKLAVLISIPINQITIYSDVDVVFFPGAKELVDLIESNEERPRYLLDCAGALDGRLLLSDSEKSNPANAGFILFRKPLDWRNSLSRLELIKGAYALHTEQTIVHLVLRENDGFPLCPDKFILRLDDQFIYKDMYASNSIALRHYVAPIRYKFWINVGIY